MIKPITAHKERLRCCHTVVPAARKLQSELSELKIHATPWTDYIWDVKHFEGQSQQHLFVPGPVLGHLVWVFQDLLLRLNRLCTGNCAPKECYGLMVLDDEL